MLSAQCRIGLPRVSEQCLSGEHPQQHSPVSCPTLSRMVLRAWTGAWREGFCSSLQRIYFV